ncbi:MAG: ExbD/TolR family protein, partial [Planctomycetota bacterium]
MRVQSRDPLDELAQNLAPMIDVVFLLLIFFMVATTFVDPEQELDLEPPTTESGAEWTEAPEELVIQVTRDGRILLEGLELDEGTLRARL